MTIIHELERRGLWLSILGALFMAGLGIGFAILTSSDAVLLDGLFSLVGAAIGLVSLRVATLVHKPDDEIYHFGYAAYEPMLNLTKGLLMAFITLFALVSAVEVVLHGGRTIEAGWASVYAAIAAAGCFAIAFSQKALARKTASPLLAVDSKNWLIDGLMSVAVGVAFVVAVLLANTSWSYLLPYADPAVVIILVVISIPIPIRIIRDNWNQLLGRAPDEALQRQAQEAVATVFDGAADVNTRLRMQQIGRYTYLQLFVVCGDETPVDIERMDSCRAVVHQALAGEFNNLALDVVFTHDPRWVAVSVGHDMVPSSEAFQEDSG